MSPKGLVVIIGCHLELSPRRRNKLFPLYAALEGLWQLDQGPPPRLQEGGLRMIKVGTRGAVTNPETVEKVVCFYFFARVDQVDASFEGHSSYVHLGAGLELHLCIFLRRHYF